MSTGLGAGAPGSFGQLQSDGLEKLQLKLPELLTRCVTATVVSDELKETASGDSWRPRLG